MAKVETKKSKKSFPCRLARDLKKNKFRYLIILPVIAYYFIFCYKPMYGAIIAFKDYSPALGIMESPWVGFKHFLAFFDSFYFWRILKNTIVMSLASLIFGFPAPILLALLINEVTNRHYKKFVQTVSYIPHFISLVVVCSMIKEFTMDSGIINDFLSLFGFDRVTMLNEKQYFVPIYVISNIWQQIGWDSIIYLAALTGVSRDLYEAADLDGASKLKQVFYVTLPGILPTIITMLLLKIGNILNVGYEKVILLYNEATYETADVISSYVYRKGLQEFDWSFSTAVGLFNSVINFTLLIISNKISKKVSETSLW